MDLEILTNAIAHVEAVRRSVGKQGDTNQSDLGQFLTSWTTAEFMADMMIKELPKKVNILDAGAGAGALTLSIIRKLCTLEQKPDRIESDLFEIDPLILPALRQTVRYCEELCRNAGIEAFFRLSEESYIEASSQGSNAPLLKENGSYDVAILNPPYKKLSTDSPERKFLRSVGIEAKEPEHLIHFNGERFLGPYDA
jgi:adenine-specific DNA-methyltransferase